MVENGQSGTHPASPASPASLQDHDAYYGSSAPKDAETRRTGIPSHGQEPASTGPEVSVRVPETKARAGHQLESRLSESAEA